MIELLRNLALACLTLAVLIGALAASFFLGLAVIAAILLLWVYIKLRAAGIINAPSRTPPEDPTIIEADYVVIEEKEERIQRDNA